MENVLQRHRKIWEEKKILRIIYTSWYKKIICDLTDDNGKTLEIGSGTGSFKKFKPDTISSDIDNCSWLDMCFDAHKIPFSNSSLSNIVMIDVLHHLQNPVQVLNEVNRVLRKGGRLIMIEPYPSLFSLFIYKRFHPEPFIFNVNYFKQKNKGAKNPWESNQAIPYLLFFKHQNQLLNKISKSFIIKKREKMSLLLYPLSGGFEKPSLIPAFLIPLFTLFELLLSPLKNLIAFRCYIVLEKI